jgi:hypothetical protein
MHKRVCIIMMKEHLIPQAHLAELYSIPTSLITGRCCNYYKWIELSTSKTNNLSNASWKEVKNKK